MVSTKGYVYMFMNKISMSQTSLYINFFYKKATRFLQQPVTCTLTLSHSRDIFVEEKIRKITLLIRTAYFCIELLSTATL